MAALAYELGAFVRRQLAGRAFASIDVGAMDPPLAKGGRVQVEVCGDPRDAAVCDLAQTHGLGLEFRGEGAALPLLDDLCLLVHGVPRASIVANFGAHESEASADPTALILQQKVNDRSFQRYGKLAACLH